MKRENQVKYLKPMEISLKASKNWIYMSTNEKDTQEKLKKI